MGYLIRNIIGSIIVIIGFGIAGFIVSHDTQSFLYLLPVLVISFIVPYLALAALTLNKEKFFESEPEEKIRYRIFYKKAIYPASIIDFIIILIMVSGTFHFSEIVQSLLQAIVLALLAIVLNGLMFLIVEYLPSNYNYNHYRALLTLATKTQNDIQSQHFLRAIRYYDKHIRVNFGLAINSVEIIFNRYVLLDLKDKNTLLTSLINKEVDTLADIKKFDKSLSLSGNVLIKTSSAQVLKDFNLFVIPIIAIVLTVLQLIFHLE